MYNDRFSVDFSFTSPQHNWPEATDYSYTKKVNEEDFYIADDDDDDADTLEDGLSQDANLAVKGRSFFGALRQFVPWVIGSITRNRRP